MTSDEQPMSAKDLATFLGCSEKRARRFFADGDVPNAYRIGGRWFTDYEGARLVKEALQHAAKNSHAANDQQRTQKPNKGREGTERARSVPA